MGSGDTTEDEDIYAQEYGGRRYRIGEFSAMTGMSASRIRFYEKEGLFGGAKEENGYRYFTPQDAFRANAFRMLLARRAARGPAQAGGASALPH